MIPYTHWTIEKPLSELPPQIYKIFKEYAQQLYYEFTNYQLIVEKTDAPYPMHQSHGIRKVILQNPEWYRSWFNSPGPYLRRDCVKNAFKHILSGSDKPRPQIVKKTNSIRINRSYESDLRAIIYQHVIHGYESPVGFIPGNEIAINYFNNICFSSYLDSEDIRLGKKLYEIEQIDHEKPFELFHALVYCILSAREVWEKQRHIHKKLEIHGFNNPRKILNICYTNELKKIISSSIYPNLTFNYLQNTASWWLRSGFEYVIKKDMTNGRSKEFDLRMVLSENKEVKGVSYKVASLFMTKCGYKNVCCIDIWVYRFLKTCGYDVPKINRGFDKKFYMAAEQIITNMASKLEVPPSVLHYTIWHRMRRNNISVLKLDLDA